MRWSRSIICLVLAFLVVPAAASAKPLAVGDSVMRGANHELQGAGFRVNAQKSRQWNEGVDAVRSIRKRGVLPRNLVVHLGNNGYIPAGGCVDMLKAAKGSTVFFVTVTIRREWRSNNNGLLRDCAEKKERAKLIDWAKASNGHPGWFAEDGAHLSSSGAEAYSKKIDATVD